MQLLMNQAATHRSIYGTRFKELDSRTTRVPSEVPVFETRSTPAPSKAIVAEATPHDSELPLFQEIADQLQQHAKTDRATAIRKARQLLESAFRSLHDAMKPLPTVSDLRPLLIPER